MGEAFLANADLLKALSNPIRLCLVYELWTHDELTVSELLEKAECSQSMISQSLGKLKDVGIVEMERRGSFSHYRLVDEKVREIMGILFKDINE